MVPPRSHLANIDVQEHQLVAVMGVMSILLVAISALGLAGMSKANDGLKPVYEDRLVPSVDLGNVRQLMTENRLALASAQATRSPEFLARHAPRSARARSTGSIT